MPDALTCLVGLDLVVPAIAWIERPQEVLADLDVGAAADVMREVGAAGCEHAGDLRPVDGGRVAAGPLVRRSAEFERIWLSSMEQAHVALASATERVDTSTLIGLAIVRMLVTFSGLESSQRRR